MTDNQTPTFSQFIRKTLSIDQYEALSSTLGISQNKLTRLLKTPADTPYEVVLKLEKLLNIKAIQLVEQFELGIDKITIRQHSFIQ
jgi:ribosome-binding protein aMBF1 (putative translation factor)